MYNAAIFDFDGVILDSFQDQYKWFRHISSVLEKKFPYKNIDEFKEDYREPVYPDMYRFLGFDWDSEKNIIWKEYNQHKANAKIELFDDIQDTIKELNKRGINLAIASSNTHDAIYKHLRNNNLDIYFQAVVCKEDLPVENCEPLLKPNPACIMLALNKLQNPTNAIYIGDQPSDIIATKRAGIASAAVTYGYSSKEKLLEHSPDYVVDNPKQILELF